MLPKLSSLLAIPALLAATAVAAPAIEVPAALVAREACPTATWWLAWSYSTTWRATTTVTNGWSSLGSVTSTKTEEETRTINTRTTIFSPATTTLPATTLSPTVTDGTTTYAWYTVTETVTSPGYAPTPLCQVTTVTHTIPSTTHVTYTYDLFYDTTWASTTGHVSTVTNIHFTTHTFTDTKAGTTVYATTITNPVTVTAVDITIATETKTIWDKGCQSYACQQQ
ncbi:hypothetical protein F5144DRAFT_23988 [Chaetomium tenue]|uniref:Uncharacterized protein n=1 Tax=Chaetomium tenue TaxID=1854479 RepID=A0ACB7PNE0_9PEZI|nr:hypothetical protein F5144DRAFT_23988 [Chaetomium globosum]